MHKHISEEICARPRNPWTRVLAALKLVEHGYHYDTQRVLDTIAYADEIPQDILRMYRDLISAQYSAGKINIPADFSRNRVEGLHPHFRALAEAQRYPPHYPYGLALPRIAGAGNDTWHFSEFSASLGAVDVAIPVDIVFCPVDPEAARQFVASIERQQYRGNVRIHMFGEQRPWGLPLETSAEITYHPVTLPSRESAELLAGLAREHGVVIFASGSIVFDETTLERIARVASISDRVVQAFVPLPAATDNLVTPFSGKAAGKAFGRPYPFRDVRGMNFALTTRMLRQVQGFDHRFSGTFQSARELCFRLFNRGCYFQPVFVPHLEHFKRSEDRRPKESTLFGELSPNPWDRKSDGTYLVPKVSIYIPAWNASKYIRRAIDSVLEQDMEDLEVCVADDGSSDKTADLLKRHYGKNPKVRWIKLPNGGIGFASNQAISLTRGLYVGQLDSDDRLKPGAVRRLASYLDENTDVVCCYSSCERIDAEENYISNEYSWPRFSREKLLLTSIVHHFRMFRRQAWERTEGFREDIANAVDYDFFLKLSEVGRFHHVEEILYQRRWHGSNTSSVHVDKQTSNTHRVQAEALARLGLDPFWELHVPDASEPRKITYRRKTNAKHVTFWPDYSRKNPYQRLLYAPDAHQVEFAAGTIGAALRLIEGSPNPEDHVFHLHWTNFLFRGAEGEAAARDTCEQFLTSLAEFRAAGGKLVWTIHNVLSHESPYPELEVEISRRLAEAVDVIHLHSALSIPEVEAVFAIPSEKIKIAPHGNFLPVYPNYVSPGAARRYLNIRPEDDVFLFNGQIRGYKGVGMLIEAFRTILAENPNALLVLAGQILEDPFSDLSTPLTEAERSRIYVAGRFIDNLEVQLFLNAADFAVYPYRNILTSGSLMLALGFGLPAVLPDVGMAREVLGTQGDAGLLYDGGQGTASLTAALREMVDRKRRGGLHAMKLRARALAENAEWRPIFSA